MEATEYLKYFEKKSDRVLKCDVHQARYKKCAELAIGETFVDVGCAFGESTHYMKNYRPGNWTGVEFDVTAVRKAEDNFPDIKFLYIKEPKYLSLVKYDTVVCSEVIEHVEKDREFVESLIAMTGKRLIMTTPNKKVISVGHLRVYTKSSLLELFKGYSVDITENDRFFYVIMNVAKQ